MKKQDNARKYFPDQKAETRSANSKLGAVDAA
jgi:hypothetical protein